MKSTKGIPIVNYFDKDIYRQEMDCLFKNNISYIGARSMLKKDGDFRVIERLNDSKILTLKNGKLNLLENVCSHRQAKIATGCGNSQNITCPLHCWSYDGNGDCINTPLFDGTKEDYRLSSSVFESWHNLLFVGERNFAEDLKNFPLISEMKIEKMIYSKSFTEKLNFNWKHYIDGFAEDYHVPFVHPGFASFVDLKSISWINQEHYTSQLFKLKNRQFLESHQTTPKYQQWVQQFLNYYPNTLPQFGGILIMYYPNIMIEWYPLFMAISTVHPTGPESCINHIDFFHHYDVLENHPELKTAAEVAYMETADEDAVMCEHLAAGRKILYEEAKEEQGPYQAPFEDGLVMFHRYYHKMMKKNII